MSIGIYTVKEPQLPEPIPAGMYKAKLAGWEEKTGGNFGPYLRLEFEITEGEYAKTKRSFIASSKITKGKTTETSSKLFRALTGLLGREPLPNEEISLKEMVGKKCQILVEDTPGKENWQNITKIVP